ncbi:nucleotide modification associated domain-containing protein [Ruoffia tabacinasalis]|nr:nucleotide modification associated domain-containing protein [Ruoffia tabacinasalis]
MGNILDFIGEQVTLNGVTGSIIGVKDKETLLLFDSVANQNINAKMPTGLFYHCTSCDKVKPIEEFGKGEICASCRVESYQLKEGETPLTFKHITDLMNNLYERKNADYGNSFDRSLDADGLLVAKIRLGDKYNRFSQLISKQAQIKSESIEDTLIDLANYAVMTLIWLSKEDKNV